MKRLICLLLLPGCSSVPGIPDYANAKIYRTHEQPFAPLDGEQIDALVETSPAPAWNNYSLFQVADASQVTLNDLSHGPVTMLEAQRGEPIGFRRTVEGKWFAVAGEKSHVIGEGAYVWAFVPIRDVSQWEYLRYRTRETCGTVGGGLVMIGIVALPIVAMAGISAAAKGNGSWDGLGNR